MDDLRLFGDELSDLGDGFSVSFVFSNVFKRLTKLHGKNPSLWSNKPKYHPFFSFFDNKKISSFFLNVNSLSVDPK